ncbi:hypothetical protein P378_13320 [Desulforamulus profundi]|uniref:Uncharacterized protein n=1 Tax=Desulforamulus profundi TaxID=1383067 RepID=A0A2C6ME19_9FIRM|nr:hypothetical protein P378_13320 [Desulforamulus profundi]
MVRAICSLLSVFSVSPVIELVIFTALVGIVFLIQLAL